MSTESKMQRFQRDYLTYLANRELAASPKPNPAAYGIDVRDPVEGFIVERIVAQAEQRVDARERV